MVFLAGLVLSAMVSLTLTYNAWWLLPSTAVVFGMLVLIHRRRKVGPLARVVTTAIDRVNWIVAAGLLVVALVTQTPWVPRERIETTNGTFTGYVLSVEPGFLNVLTDDHEFVIVVSGDVISRS